MKPIRVVVQEVAAEIQADGHFHLHVGARPAIDLTAREAKMVLTALSTAIGANAFEDHDEEPTGDTDGRAAEVAP